MTIYENLRKNGIKKGYMSESLGWHLIDIQWRNTAWRTGREKYIYMMIMHDRKGTLGYSKGTNVKKK